MTKTLMLGSGVALLIAVGAAAMSQAAGVDHGRFRHGIALDGMDGPPPSSAPFYNASVRSGGAVVPVLRTGG